MSKVITGSVYVVKDNIDTDQIIPAQYLNLIPTVKEEYDKLVTAFQARVAKLQKDIQYKRQAIDNAYQTALSRIRTLAMEEVTKIAGEKKIDLILKRDSSVIFLPHLNVSDEVLNRLNERTKNARIEIQVQEPQSQ